MYMYHVYVTKYIHSSVTKENLYLNNHSSMAPTYIQSYNLQIGRVGVNLTP